MGLPNILDFSFDEIFVSSFSTSSSQGVSRNVSKNRKLFQHNMFISQKLVGLLIAVPLLDLSLDRCEEQE